MILFSIIDFWRNASIETYISTFSLIVICLFLLRILLSVLRIEKMVEELKDKNKE